MNVCEQCGGLLITTTNATIVCSECGIVVRVQLLSHITPRDWHTDPLVNVYSRRKRFKALLENLFYPHASRKDNRMMEYLTPLSPFQTKDELLCVIKRSKVSDKRYCTTHYFCKAFVREYTAPPVIENIPHMVKILLNRFSDIECVFSRLFPNVQFFNYAWLLSELLKEFKLIDFREFVKKLKCKQRVTYYSLMLQEIYDLIRNSNRFYSTRTL